MAAFPTTLSSTLVSFKSSTFKPSNRQTSSAGYTMSFPNGTTSKKIFEFGLSYLSNTEKATLQTFFDTNQGITFTVDFTVTGDTTTYNVVFDQDQLDFVYLKRFPAEYSVQIKVKEV